MRIKKLSSYFFFNVTYLNFILCLHSILGNNGDYDEIAESDDDEEEFDGEQSNAGIKVNVLKAYSMGCTEEESWKRYAP